MSVHSNIRPDDVFGSDAAGRAWRRALFPLLLLTCPTIRAAFSALLPSTITNFVLLCKRTNGGNIIALGDAKEGEKGWPGGEFYSTSWMVRDTCKRHDDMGRAGQGWAILFPLYGRGGDDDRLVGRRRRRLQNAAPTPETLAVHSEQLNRTKHEGSDCGTLKLNPGICVIV